MTVFNSAFYVEFSADKCLMLSNYLHRLGVSLKKKLGVAQLVELLKF